MRDPDGIRWREWGPAAFDEAKKSDKPIVLRLSASWCHWCHVMDKTSDATGDAIRLLNDHYVPIRVDIDQMPDVRERYNFGGYPTSVFLTPEGEILTGGTYIPPDRWVELLDRVHQAYRSQKPDILRQLKEHRARHDQAPTPLKTAAPPSIADDLLEAASAAMLMVFDAEHGGFGSQPKFPNPAGIEFALRLFQDTGRKEYEVVARRSLDAMREGDLYDEEEDAFFRYCVRREWQEPHFEKMLETNAGLLAAYAASGAALGRDDYLSTVQGVRRYVEKNLRNATTGLFYGSQDADEEYYALPLAQRQTKKPPFIDRTHHTDWNAQMILAYCTAYRATGKSVWLREGRRSLDALVQGARPGRGGFLHYVRDGAAHRDGIFSDQVYGVRALIDLHELTGEDSYLDVAEAVLGYARAAMWDEGRGRFNDKASRDEDLGLLTHPQSSVVENGVAMRALLRLHRLRPDPAYESTIAQLWRGHADAGHRYGLFAAEFGIAALELRRPPLEVHVVGAPEDVEPLVLEAARIHNPHVLLLASPRPSGVGVAPPDVRPPAAYVCAGQTCSRLYRPGEAFARDAERLASARIKTT